MSFWLGWTHSRSEPCFCLRALPFSLSLIFRLSFPRMREFRHAKGDARFHGHDSECGWKAVGFVFAGIGDVENEAGRV